MNKEIPLNISTQISLNISKPVFEKKLNPADQKIYELCKKYGQDALEARRKFAGLLPQVYERRIYEKKGFSSIFEFAAKFCGMSQEQVRLILNLEKRLSDKPILKNLLTRGEISANKLARIITIATPENQEDLATKVKLLSKNALEVFVKDKKFAIQNLNILTTKTSSTSLQFKNHKGSLKPENAHESLPGQIETPAQNLQTTLEPKQLNFQLSDEIIDQLNSLNAQGHDINELLTKLLKQRTEKIAEEKAEISANIKPANSRYIPAAIKNILKEEYGTKCAIPGCNKNAETIHHDHRFALSQNHDPNFMRPLCREHHEIVHTLDLKYHHLKNFR